MENNRNTIKTIDATHYENGSIIEYNQDVIREEPLLITVEGSPYSIVMRTPGDEIAHAAGFCFSEGLIDIPEDIAAMGYCSDLDENSVTIKIVDSRKVLVSNLLGRQGFLSQTSCGICGRDMIDDLVGNLKVIEDESWISYSQVLLCIDKFFRHQEYYNRTRGAHAVMLFDRDFNIIRKAEDVGRHNAMDKSIGNLFLSKKLDDIRLAVLSSRISFEMIQKAARAQIPILISLSNPTSMAVELALELNMTLVSLDKNNNKSGFMVTCGEKRIKI
ncbi:MAG: formate dehydrogenase accessory sulfurtransferase FdhD [Deltaproteobacteria bacterium]|nr:formate dehydrogenase accessory sulfurtransferase FdhD [Deltaproteobacteria bacterium]